MKFLPKPVCKLESHKTQRIGLLRAAVLGANDGIVSSANLAMTWTAGIGTLFGVVA